MKGRVYFTFMGVTFSTDEGTYEALQKVIEREGAVPDLSQFKTADNEGRRYKVNQIKRVPAGHTVQALVGQQLRTET